MNINSEYGLAKPFSTVSTLSEFVEGRARPTLLTLLHSSMDGLLLVNSDHLIVLVNQKAERIFGYASGDLLQTSLDVLMPMRSASEQRRRIDRFCAKGGRRTRLALKAVHADGAPLSLCVSVSRVMVHGESYLAIVIHHSERRRPQPEPSEIRRWAVSTQHASEVEKRRFSKKLYDDIGQRLSVLKLDLDWLENSLPKSKDGAPARVAQMQGLLDNVITMTKSMASALRPPLLDDFGLLAAVEWMAANFQKRTGIACSVESGNAAIKLEEPAESAIFRVIQEALANIEKHAHARSANISMEQTEGRLDVMIRDDGTGIQCAGGVAPPGCYGLLAMQERIFILGGTISIENAVPSGVLIRASIPLESVPCVELNRRPTFR